jgi:mRNA interferase RelE/StbE
MAFRIELTSDAVKDLAKLDRPVAVRIQKFLRDRVGQLDDPRAIGSQLVGVPYWRYRVGDYRILAVIEDHRLVVLVVEIGHRSSVYRGR